MRWMMSSSLAMALSTRFLRLKKNKPNTHRLCKSLRRRRRRLVDHLWVDPRAHLVQRRLMCHHRHAQA